MMGRVVSFIALVATAMNPAGLFLAGWLGDALGVRAGLWIGGGAIAVLAALILLSPAVGALNRRDAATPPAIPDEVTADATSAVG